MTKEEKLALESILESCEKLSKQSEEILKLLGRKNGIKDYFKKIWQTLT